MNRILTKKVFVKLFLFIAIFTLVGAVRCGSALAYDDLQVTAWRAPDAITIDADLEEWNLSSPIVLDSEDQLVRDPNQWDGPEDLSAQVYVMWDPEYIYIAAEVQDDTPFMYREGFPPDMADAIVLFFSTDPQADPERTHYGSTDFRVILIIDDYLFNTGIDRDMVGDTCGLETVGDGGDEQILDGYEYAVREIAGGYIYEARIPWTNFANEQIPVLVPEEGIVIGFDLSMYDLDFPCPGVATVSMVWTGSDEGETNPSTWGSLEFK